MVDRRPAAALDDLRRREKAATRELDAIAAQRRRLPMVELPDYTLIGPDGPIRLVDVFDGRSQLIVYNHMWFEGEEWQCGGCTRLTSQYVRLGFLDNYDARFVIVTNGPIDEALAYKAKVGNKMDWYSSSESSFGADVGAPPGAGFAVNVFLRDGDKVYRTWHTDGRGTEQLSYTFALVDILPWGRQEEWQDSPDGWPQSPTYSGWLDSPDVARLYGPNGVAPSALARLRTPAPNFQSGRAVSTSPDEWITPSASSCVSSSSDEAERSASTARVCSPNRGAGPRTPIVGRSDRNGAAATRAPGSTSTNTLALLGPRRVGELWTVRTSDTRNPNGSKHASRVGKSGTCAHELAEDPPASSRDCGRADRVVGDRGGDLDQAPGRVAHERDVGAVGERKIG